MQLALKSAALALALAAVAPAGAAFAQIKPFQAEIDCGGVVAPGAVVPYAVRLENQRMRTLQLRFSVFLRPAGEPFVSLLEEQTELLPNEDEVHDFTLALAPDAEVGDYRMAVVARAGNRTSFDTCSFKVE